MGRKGYWVDELHCFAGKRSYTEYQLKQAVLEASRELLVEVGPRGFTVVEASRRSGVARTTVYKYFGTKAGLLAACREQRAQRAARNLAWSPMAARTRARQNRRHTRLHPVLETVRQAVLALVEHTQAETDLFLLAAAEGLRSCRRPHCQTPPDHLPYPIPRQFMRGIVDLLREAKARHILRPDLEPLAVSGWLAALWWHELCLRGPLQDSMPPERDRLSGALEHLLAAVAA